MAREGIPIGEPGVEKLQTIEQEQPDPLVPLWRAFDAGDERALHEQWAVIQQSIRPKIEGVFKARVRTARGLDDLLQETFLHAFLGLKSFHRENGFDGFVRWVKQIARNKGADLIRKEVGKSGNRPMEVPLPGQGTDTPQDYDRRIATEDTPEKAIMGKEVDAELYRGLLALPVRERTAVILRELLELGGVKVGTVLGLSEGMVSRLVTGAKERMKEVLSDEDASEIPSDSPTLDELIALAKAEARAKLPETEELV